MTKSPKISALERRGIALAKEASLEAARTAHCSVVTERTARDLYLKAFELIVKYSDPRSLMTSLNCVNGPHGANSKDLGTYVLRDEWGFNGFVMTDWNTTTPARGGSTAGCIRPKTYFRSYKKSPRS